MLATTMALQEEEIIIDSQSVLISKTNLKGVITYVSPDFLRISEYEEVDLLNKPHNKIRHPDMPSEVFKQLWQTIKTGRPWSGIVKNRSKSGKFYWVEATISPLWKKGKVHGYISVRKTASRKQIHNAEQLYQKIKTGKIHQNPLKKVIASLEKIGFSVQAQGLYALLMLPFLMGIAAGWLQSGWLIAFCIILWMMIFPAYFVYTNKIDKKGLDAILSLNNRIAGGCFAAEISREVDESIFKNEQKDIYLSQKVILISFWGVISKIKALLADHKNLSQNMVKLSGEFSDLTRNQAASYEEITSTIKELALAMDNVSDSIQSQTGNLKLIEESIDDISNSITINTQNLEKLESISSESMQKVKQGKEIIQDIVRAMDEIKNSSKKIESILGFIQEVSEKTNLLSINASIESARAGEEGKGFRVVASEISKLADETNNNVKQIRALIQESGQTIETGNQKVLNSVEIFDEVSTLVASLGEHINDVSQKMLNQFEKALLIQKNAKEAFGFAHNINEGVKTQNIFTTEVHKAVEDLANKTVGISEKAESLHDFSKQLVEPSQKLQDLTEHIEVSNR